MVVGCVVVLEGIMVVGCVVVLVSVLGFIGDGSFSAKLGKKPPSSIKEMQVRPLLLIYDVECPSGLLLGHS